MAGWLPRPGVVLGIGLVVLVGGFVVAALFPLSDVLRPLAGLSPWDWALGGDPLVNGGAPWRHAALVTRRRSSRPSGWPGSPGATCGRPDPAARAELRFVTIVHEPYEPEDDR